MPYGKWEPCRETKCRKCYSDRVNFRKYESSDGGHEDYQYHCVDCQHEWWIDGIDA